MVLEKFEVLCRDINLLIDNTFFFAPVLSGTTYLYSVFERRLCLLLFKHYFYSILIDFISVVDDEDIIMKLTAQPSEMLTDALEPNYALLEECSTYNDRKKSH